MKVHFMVQGDNSHTTTYTVQSEIIITKLVGYHYLWKGGPKK